MFATFSQNKFVGSTDASIVSWCPNMDLLTITINRMSLWVYRMNGDRIYSVNNRSPITDICWKPDGKSFALMGINGVCKIYDSNSGVLVHVIEPKSTTMNITQCINWFIEPFKNSYENKFNGIFDLDITRSLPDLLPTTSESGNIIVDKILEVPESLDLLLIIDNYKSLSLTMNNLFTVSGVQLPSSVDSFLHHGPLNADKQFYLVNANDQLALLQSNLHLDKYDNYVTNVIFACSKIGALLTYLEESILSLSTDSKSFLSVFERYLANFSDSLYEGVDLTTHFPTAKESEDKMKSSLHHILLTGIIPESLKDYWMNQFGERGLKKLSSLGVTCYDSIRRICYTQIIVALERLISILAKQESISLWLNIDMPARSKSGTNETENRLGSSSTILSKAISTAKLLLKSVYNCILLCNTEQKLFEEYIDWLKNTIIERLLKQDEISTNESLNENFLITKISLSDIMTYINDYLFESKLLSIVKGLDSDLAVIRQKGTAENGNYLIDQFHQLKMILQSEYIHSVESVIRSNITFEPPIPLKLPAIDAKNCQFVISNSDTAYVIYNNIETNNLFVVNIDIKNPKKNQTLKIELDCKIQQFEIYDKTKLMILLRGDDKWQISSISLDNFNFESDTISFNSINKLGFRDFKIDTDEGFVPRYFALNSSYNKQLGCLLDDKKQKYHIILR